MKKSDRNLLIAAGAAGAIAYVALKKPTAGATVSGIPGIGALLPSTSSLIPASLRGQCSPVWLDAAVWGLGGAALGYYGLAGKKLL